MHKWIAGLIWMLALGAARGAEPVMTILAPLNHTMPLASFHNGELSGGFLKISMKCWRSGWATGPGSCPCLAGGSPLR